MQAFSIPKKNAAAVTPPMGWNSWDYYAATVTEEQLLANAEYMRKHLLPFGWEYIVCDVAWYDSLAGTTEHEYRAFEQFCMDAYSRFIPAENRFPSSRGGKGFAPLAKQLHTMGLKFGVHLMRGIPRQAAHAHTPITGGGTANEIANPFSISKWNPDMYGVYPEKPAAAAYYDSVFEQFAAWGLDLVKVDDICNTNMYPHAPYSGKGEIELIRRAIDQCGRPMVLSLSPGPALIEEAAHLAENGNMWRITDDFWDNWAMLKNMFHRCEIWQRHVRPGCWPDCDMLPLGKIGRGFGTERRTRFTPDEQRTMMTLWCVFRSPLMMGGDMPQNDEWTLSLLTNDEALAVLRFGGSPRQLYRDDTCAVWANAVDGDACLALFNLSEETRTIRCPLAAIGMEQAKVRDLWARADLPPARGEVFAELAPHAPAFFRLSPW
jgi:hypothetical protein